GHNVIPLHHPDDLARAAAMLAEAAANPGRPARADIRLRHRDGSWRWMSVIASNRLSDPEVGGIICNLRDVTMEREAALAVEAALQAQTRVNDELRRLADAKSEVLHLLSHEFRTPLTAIAGYSELLLLAPHDAEQTAEFAQTIHNEALRLNRLVSDLLLLDRMEARQLPVRRQPVDLNALAAAAAERVRGAAPNRTFRLALAAALPPAMVDPERLTQALINLLGNAIKYAPAEEPIAIATRHEGDWLVVSVADRGAGIPADQLEAIFTRFHRLATGSTRLTEGTGLGLPIVREIARLHGGDAWAESNVGEGSTFSIKLPLDGGGSG
ncbi:MAG TPA: ATP-binding protein, partial [Thermomicrobiales bacterium]|nr:ATP-binding protein [Thermomicrobiales bacterium]